jgi:hypothetical protein
MPDTVTSSPTTQDYLQKLFQQLFLPLSFNRSVNLITYSGAGKWANIRHIIDHIAEFSTDYPETAYLYLDANNIPKSPENEIENGITFMLAKAQLQQNTAVIENINKTQNIQSEYRQLLLNLLNKHNQRLVIIVNNAESLLVPDRYAQLSVSFLLTLVGLDVTKVCFLFITKAEMTYTPSNLRQLEKYYTTYTVTEEQNPYTVDCGIASLHHFEQLNKVSLSDNAIRNISLNTAGDALLVKFLFEEYLINQDLRKVLDSNQCTSDAIYTTTRQAYLDLRHEELTLKLSPKSKDFLYGQTSTPTQFLKDTALINNENKVLSSLFQYYLQYRSTRYQVGHELQFTAQEQRVFQLLLDFLGKIVTREEIAKTIWGDNWQGKYSEQAIDRIVSNLRAKIANTAYTITSAKGAGIVVEKSGA